MSKGKSIKVRIAALTKPLVVRTIKSGTTLEVFLEANELTYSASIRVNGEVAKRTYELSAGDIIFIVDNVNGGR